MATDEARRWLRGMKALVEIEDADPAALEEAIDALPDDDRARLAHAIGVAKVGSKWHRVVRQVRSGRGRRPY